MRSLFVALFLVLSAVPAMTAGPVLAVDPEEILDDPALEVRARDLNRILRCLVCQNQSVDESNAGLAREIRQVVRERLLEGDSDDQALGYLVDRYGDFVLLKPPIQPSTYFLWFGPALIALATGAGLFLLYRRQRKQPSASQASSTLSREERDRLDSLLQGD